MVRGSLPSAQLLVLFSVVGGSRLFGEKFCHFFGCGLHLQSSDERNRKAARSAALCGGFVVGPLLAAPSTAGRDGDSRAQTRARQDAEAFIVAAGCRVDEARLVRGAQGTAKRRRRWGALSLVTFFARSKKVTRPTRAERKTSENNHRQQAKPPKKQRATTHGNHYAALAHPAGL
jgi:hypothetical protein